MHLPVLPPVHVVMEIGFSSSLLFFNCYFRFLRCWRRWCLFHYCKRSFWAKSGGNFFMPSTAVHCWDFIICEGDTSAKLLRKLLRINPWAYPWIQLVRMRFCGLGHCSSLRIWNSHQAFWLPLLWLDSARSLGLLWYLHTGPVCAWVPILWVAPSWSASIRPI